MSFLVEKPARWCQILRLPSEVPMNLQKGICTIGNFDGAHLGHKAIFEQMRLNGEGCSKVVVSFYPHPASVVGNAQRVPQLAALREKAALLSHEGIDLLYLIHFTQKLSKLTAAEFIQQVLVQKLGIHTLVVGEDAAIGNRREGDVTYLQRELPAYGITCIVVPHLLKAGVRASSRNIRSLISAGKIAEANEFLGRFHTVVGRVIRGAGRGRTIGIPTANLLLPSRVLPKNGVYSCIAALQGKEFPAVTNIGTRPTFNGEGISIEAHIMRPDGTPAPLNLYGTRLTLRFVDRIRDEIRFSKVEDLVVQIKNDMQRALTTTAPFLSIR